MASEAETVAIGHWHPPRSSRAVPARLLAKGRTFFVRLDGAAGDPVSVTDVDAAQISQRVGRIPRRITFADGSLFETNDNDAVDAWLSARRLHRGGLVHELERFHPRLIGLVLAVFLLAGIIYRFALPALVEVAVLVTPPAVTDLMASGTLASLDQAVFSKSELPETRQNEIRTGFERIAALSSRGSNGYALHFRKGGYIGPNAFALPDGTLVMTDELVDLAGTDTEMLLGVLAHEIGHVERDHSLRQFYRAAGTAALIMLITGDIGNAGEEILTDGAALLTLSYSRSAESEADRISVELMARAGHDPAAIGRFFAIVEEKLGDRDDTTILSTHPGTPDRRRQIEEWAKEVAKEKGDP